MLSARLRSLILSCLVLLMAGTGVTLGTARGQAPPAGEVVICAGLSMITIRIDANGNPVSVQVPCPDATLAVPETPALPPLPLRIRFSRPLRPRPRPLPIAGARLRPWGRGPPRTV